MQRRAAGNSSTSTSARGPWLTGASCRHVVAAVHPRCTFRCHTPAAVEPAQLAAIACEPVGEVAMLAGVGALCARQGLLPLQGRRLLSGLVMNVFTPCLLFSKLGASVNVAEALRLWPLAANMVACHVAGLGLGWLQIKTLKAPASLAQQITVMTAMGNVGNLPLVLIPALISRPEVLELMNSSRGMSSGGDSSGVLLDTTAAAVAAATEVGLTYVMLGFFCASFIQFPLGYLLLQKRGQPQHETDTVTAATAGAATTSLPASPTAVAEVNSTAGTTVAAGAVVAAPASSTGQQQQQIPKIMQQVQPSEQQQQQLQLLASGIFTPPVIACLLAVPVASLPALRSALFEPGGDLLFLGDVVSLLGAPLIPCLFLVLGANLAEGPGAAQVPARVLLGLVTSKLLLHPLLGLAAILAALQAGLLPADTDPLMLLVMLLVWCAPTAVLTHSLATMLQNGEDQVSYLLFWQYLASLVTLPVCLALYLQLLQNGLLRAVDV